MVNILKLNFITPNLKTGTPFNLHTTILALQRHIHFRPTSMQKSCHHSPSHLAVPRWSSFQNTHTGNSPAPRYPLGSARSSLIHISRHFLPSLPSDFRSTRPSSSSAAQSHYLAAFSQTYRVHS